ncbi:MAG TPA: RNB domain-containing ribonuclease, partial [Solirubrobacteraceae bacterium]
MNRSGDTPTSGSRVALLERRGKFLVAEPFFERGPRLVVSRDRRANVGDLVVVRASTGRDGRERGRATVARRLGRPDIARDVIEAFMIDRGLRRSFDPAVEHEARASSELGRRDASATGRRDLRSLPTFTIDPASARDFDDAISAEALHDGSWRVWVHIADVCAFVAPRSLIDREAYRRGTSVYVPGAVEPMLPRSLSDNACSLVPGEDRLTLTVELSIGPAGVTKSAFYRSVIRSVARLDYGQVDRIFDGSGTAPGPWGEGLAAARAAAATLAARRAAKAALAVDSEEPEFAFDKHGNVASMTAVAQTESHRLIEHLMIAANEQVA